MNELEKLRKELAEQRALGKIPDSQLAVVDMFLDLQPNSVKHNRCTECQTSLNVHAHKLMLGQVETLVKLYDKFGVGEEFKLSAQVRARNHLDNFQKLRYLGLIQKKVVNGKSVKWRSRDSTSKSGVWRLTNKAKRFLVDFEPVPETVFTYKGHVLYTSKTTITVKTKLLGWLRSESYAEQAQSLRSALHSIVLKNKGATK